MKGKQAIFYFPPTLMVACPSSRSSGLKILHLKSFSFLRAAHSTSQPILPYLYPRFPDFSIFSISALISHFIINVCTHEPFPSWFSLCLFLSYPWMTGGQLEYNVQFAFLKNNLNVFLWTWIQSLLSYLSTIIPVLFLKRVLPFQKIKSNLLDVLDLLIYTSVPFSFITTPSVLSSNMFLLSLKIHLQGDFPDSFGVC